MEYINIKTPQEEVNRKGSKLWVSMNDNSRALSCRQHFVKEYGGFFKKERNMWVWISPAKQQNGYWLKNIHTEEKVFFTSMTEFGNQHGLTPVKICELLNGKRKTYKGWTAAELRNVKETVGSNVKAKEPPKKTIAIPKIVTLQNTETNEIIVVTNIKQFAKQHGIFPANLYKLVNGKAKIVKKFKLHTPLS
jgi:hypothetical protein